MSTERVWDEFLAADDKITLKERPHQVWGYGQRPALVLIDLYRWVFGDERPTSVKDAMDEWPGTCGPQAWDALPHLQRLLAAARAAELPIVHVTGLDPADSGVAGWSNRGKRETDTFVADPTKADRLRRRFHIVDEVAPLPGEAVLRKAAPSGFFGTLLMSHLHAHDVDGIILVGESTSGCVRATCVEGRSYRFKMTVVEECCFDRHRTAHAMNLFDMHQKYADVLGVDEVVGHLEKLAGKTPIHA
jgi:nicotinamidase-related amidase